MQSWNRQGKVSPPVFYDYFLDIGSKDIFNIHVSMANLPQSIIGQTNTICFLSNTNVVGVQYVYKIPV
jgi:hypothetical protein